MELVTLFPSIRIELPCQKQHVPYMRSLWAVLEVASGTASSQRITAADFSRLPEALDWLRWSLSELLNGAQSISGVAELVWDEAERKTILDFTQLKSPGLPPASCSDRENLTLQVSVQNAGLLSALWSVLESRTPDHLVNLEIASVPGAVAKIQTTLDQLLLPAINQVSCLDGIVQKGLSTEIVDMWSLSQKEFISLFIGWTLPSISYSSTLRLN